MVLLICIFREFRTQCIYSCLHGWNNFTNNWQWLTKLQFDNQNSCNLKGCSWNVMWCLEIKYTEWTNGNCRLQFVGFKSFGKRSSTLIFWFERELIFRFYHPLSVNPVAEGWTTLKICIRERSESWKWTTIFSIKISIN